MFEWLRLSEGLSAECRRDGPDSPIVYLIWSRAFPPFSPAPRPLSRCRRSPLCQFSLSSIFRGRMNLPLLSFLVHFDTRQNSSALRELEQGALVFLWQLLQEPPSISWSIVLERDLSLLNPWLVSKKKAVAGVWWYSIIYGGGGRTPEPRRLMVSSGLVWQDARRGASLSSLTRFIVYWTSSHINGIWPGSSERGDFLFFSLFFHLPIAYLGQRFINKK